MDRVREPQVEGLTGLYNAYVIKNAKPGTSKCERIRFSAHSHLGRTQRV